MNDELELRIIMIIAQPYYSAVYWGCFRRLVFGNALTQHVKLGSFSVVIFFLPISHIPPCFHANHPDRFPTYRLVFMLTIPIDFPRLIGSRGLRHYEWLLHVLRHLIWVASSRTPRLCCNVKHSSDLTPYRTLWFVEEVVIFQLCVSLLWNLNLRWFRARKCIYDIHSRAIWV